MTIVTNATFEQEVLNSEIPVLIDFFADWCMPCKMFAPIFESVAEDYEDKVKFVKVNIDDLKFVHCFLLLMLFMEEKGDCRECYQKNGIEAKEKAADDSQA